MCSRAGYYDAYYLRGAEGAGADPARFHRGVRATCDALLTPTAPSAAFAPGREDGRSGEDVSERRVHRAGQPGRHSRPVGAGGARRRRACRWACRCSASRSTRKRCSPSAPRIERAAGFTAAADAPGGRAERMSYAIEGRTGAVGSGDRAGSPCPGHLPSQAVLRRRDRVRRRAEHPGQLRRRGLPRHAAGDQPRMRRAGGAHRARPATRRSTWSAASTARTISTPTCRRAIRSASTQHPIVGKGEIEIELADGTHRSRSASPACIWSRTPANACTTSTRPRPTSTSTAPAWR